MIYYTKEDEGSWLYVKSETLRGAKTAASKRAENKNTTVSVAIRVANCFITLCEKKPSQSWHDFDLIVE